MKIRDEYSKLTGPEKAAIMILSLGEEHASKLFSHMDDEEIREISQAMSNLGTVSANVIERLFVDFANGMSATGSLTGSYDSTERILLKSLSREKVDEIMEDIRGPSGRTMWDKLNNVNENVLANYLKNEYPQTVAVILSKLKPEQASRILEILPESFSMEVIMRMLRMEAIQKEVLADVERTLRMEFMANLAKTTRRDMHEQMAEILNNMDGPNSKRFMACLEDRNRDSAERVRSLMFTFEDLANIGPSGIQALLRTVDKKILAMALKGTSPEIRDVFFTNMSERAGKFLREEIQMLGGIKASEVEDARNSMVQTAKQMAARGEIAIAENADDELIY